MYKIQKNVCEDSVTLVAFIYIAGVVTGALLASLRSDRGPSPSWIDQVLRMNTATEVLEKAITDKRKRATLELLLSMMLVLATAGVTWRSSPMVWRYWSTTAHSVWIPPILNESIIIIQCALTTIVFAAVTAMLHLTGMLKWLRVLLAKLWFDLFFATCGDPHDNTYLHDLSVKIALIRDEVQEQLGYACQDFKTAERHPNWNCIRLGAQRQLRGLQEDAKERAMCIASDTLRRIDASARTSVHHAVEHERQFILGLRRDFKIA